jgi:aminoglycoside/choline kinase family phosphotransferase
VLFASLLEAVGIRTALVFTGTDDSAHAFVAWETTEAGGIWRYLETNGFVTATFDEARKEAEGKAAAFEAEQKASGAGIFARLAIRDLREQNINPLE